MISKLIEEKFINEIKSEKFYEAHETLEKIWFPKRKEKSLEIKMIKGFINAAVSFRLYQLGREDSSKEVFNTYLKYEYKENKKYIHIKTVINEINEELRK